MNVSMPFNRGYFYFERWRVSMDPLLPVVILFMAWLLSDRYYPDIIYLESSYLYWVLGILTSVFITVSIVVHEIGHSLAARYFGIPIQRIHLYLFGGMAELQHRPHNARQEWWIALAGPLASILLAGFFWGLSVWMFSPLYAVYYVLNFLALINFLIGIFNLLPIFPLDGGRLMRAVLWKFKGNVIQASRITNRTGSVFTGLLLILALFDYFFVESGYAFFAGILALYLLYTYYTGRGELKYNPAPEELIYSVGRQHDTESLIEGLAEYNPSLIESCIIPVVKDGPILYVVDGVNVDLDAVSFSVDGHRRSLEYGDFIDLRDDSSFAKTITFKAQWVPVLRDKEFIGMCEAREMRFWLDQNIGEISGL